MNNDYEKGIDILKEMTDQMVNKELNIYKKYFLTLEKK